MGSTRISGDAIWLRNIEGDSDLKRRLLAMRPGEVIDLEVAGIIGKWERMRAGRDGRPTYGIRPIAEMREVWARLRRGEPRRVPIRPVIAADTYLASLAPLLGEWDSAEDTEAYGDL